MVSGVLLLRFPILRFSLATSREMTRHHDQDSKLLCQLISDLKTLTVVDLQLEETEFATAENRRDARMTTSGLEVARRR